MQAICRCVFGLEFSKSSVMSRTLFVCPLWAVGGGVVIGVDNSQFYLL